MSPGQPLSEPIIIAPTEGPQHITPFGDVLVWKTGGEVTGGGFSLHERTAPPGSASFPHVHHEVIEAFYVLEGELEFRVGDREFAGKMGSFVMAPRGVPHAWRNATNETAKALVTFAPSAQYGYFEEIDQLTRSAPTGMPDPQALGEIAEKYGLA